MNQYIITEEVAEIIETALESDEHCKKCPYEGGGFKQGALSLLRECPYQQPEQFTSQKKNYHGGECTCNEFVNCHDCRDALSYKEQDVKELGILRNILALQKESDDEIRKDERDKVLDKLESMLIESCTEDYEPNGMGCKCCPFLVVYDDGLQCAVKELRQAGEQE